VQLQKIPQECPAARTINAVSHLQQAAGRRDQKRFLVRAERLLREFRVALDAVDLRQVALQMKTQKLQTLASVERAREVVRVYDRFQVDAFELASEICKHRA
jgi:hypothetical protein